MNCEKPKKPSLPNPKGQAQKITKEIETVQKQVLKQIPTSKITLSYQSDVPASKRLKITRSEEVAELLKKLWNQNTLELQEEFGVLYLNNSNHVLGFYPHSRGGLQSALIDVRLVLSTALLCGAVSMILCHNHPSGNTTPSKADHELTQKVSKAAKLLDIKLLDHIILTKEAHYSFADSGDL